MPSRGSGCPTGQGLGITVLFCLCECVPFCRTVFFTFVAFWCCVVSDKIPQLQWKVWHMSSDGRVDTQMLMFCVVLQSMRHLPEELENLWKKQKLHWWVFLCAFFFFSIGQITVGRFNSHYNSMKKGRRWQRVPNVLPPNAMSLCVLQSLEHRLYWGVSTSTSTHSSHIK